MRSHTLLLAASSLLALAVAAPVSAQVQPTDPWAQIASDVPVDASVRFGRLPNGMQYAVMRNATPPGQASLRLRIDAGSLMETEQQLGLAHFMEHMAFNGTTNIPENELLRILERHGLAFGADTNAYTSFGETVYMLELPRADTATVDDALKVLREQVSEALMDPAAIDAERGVIEGEERLRNTPGLRSLKTQLALLAPGQRVSQRLPIGDLEIIRTAPRDRFVEFYDAYYQPSRATFIAVGDFDVDEMEGRIRESFQSWRPRAPGGPDPDLGAVAPRTPETRILVEPGVQSSIQLSWTRAPDRDADTVAERREDTARLLGLVVLNRRLDEISRSEQPPFSAAAGQEFDLADSIQIAQITAQFAPGAWRAALESIEREQRRLTQFGVSDAELQREIAEVRTGLENAVAGAATRRTPVLAAGLLNAVDAHEVFSAPQTDLDLFNAAVNGLTAASVSETLKDVFSGGGPLALVISPVEIAEGEAGVTAALEGSRRTTVSAPVGQVALEWPYASFGQTGVVAASREISEIGATIVTFANGVRLTVKPTAFRDDQILVGVRTGIGELGLLPTVSSPQLVAPAVVPQGGLGRMTLDEMDRALTGRTYSVSVAAETDSYVLNGETRRADLELQMQVLAAYVTDPGLRAAPLAMIQSVLPQRFAQLRATPGGAFQIDGRGLLASGDKRESLPTAEDIASWTIEDLRAGITAGLSAGPIDVIVVGDTTVEAAVAAAAATFGALPPRGPDPQPAAGATVLRFPAGNTEPVRLRHDGPAEQGFAFIAWPTVDAVADATESRRVSLLAKVLELRVLDDIRERQALAYSPSVSSSTSDVYEGYGLISISAETAADKIETFYAAVGAIVAGLQAEPPSEDELNRARLPAIEGLRRRQADNEYWLTQLADVAERPAEVDQTLSHIPDLEAVMPADVQALARRYLRAETAWKATVTSAP